MKVIDNQKLYRQWIPNGVPLYLQPTWMDVFSTNWSARIGLNAQGEPVWLWPYQKKSKYGIDKYGRIPFCQDNGPVFLDPKTYAMFDPEINRWFSKIIVDDRRNVLNKDLMLKRLWRKEERFYQYFDLKYDPHGFQDVSKSKRNRIKKSGLYEFARIQGSNEVYSLFLNLFHSIGYLWVTMNDIDQWKKALDERFDHYLFALRDEEGNILSCQWVVGFGNTLYAWQSARNFQFQNTYARERLLWHAIEWAKKRYHIYDLGGSSLPGVRKFNLEMGAKEVGYQRYVMYHPKWAGRVFGT